MSTQQDIYAAGSKNRSPMLNKENYVPWSSRLLRYAKSRPNRHNSIINGPYVRRMIPEPAIQTILLDLPEDIYAAVDSCETAQEIWLRAQQMMKGSDNGIQEKKAKLFNEWERFTSTDGESIESVLVSQPIFGTAAGECMRTHSSSNLHVESPPNPSTSNPQRRNRRRSKQPFIPEESPVDTMADQRTMEELLHEPTEGYVEAIVVPPRFLLYKDLIRACPHHGFTELHQLDTFYNTLDPADQDSLNSAAGGNLLERRTQDVLTLQLLQL
nr:reverse transcriptase domain-containing protein [Tanacetum cinerariifolium]